MASSSTTPPVTMTTVAPAAVAPAAVAPSNQVSYVDVAGLMGVLQNYLVNSPLIKNTNGDVLSTSQELTNINTNLNQISTALGNNTSGNILSQQSGVDSIVTNEINRLNEKKQTIDGAITTQKRMVQMNDSYIKRQRDYTKILVAISVGIVLMIFAAYFSYTSESLRPLATIFDIVIIVLVFIYCFWTYYNMSSRDNIYYDQLYMYGSPSPPQYYDEATINAAAASKDASGNTCTGPACCSAIAGTTWDASGNVCIKKEGFTNQRARPLADKAMPFSPSEEDDYQRI
jgi:ElaB/YqjD/DUF883 family membrane-anchored ribosome-binding protein